MIPANDNFPPGAVPLIGIIRDNGRVERFNVVLRDIDLSAEELADWELSSVARGQRALLATQAPRGR